MLRKELLDARRSLRSAGEGLSGPRSKKQRGEWDSSQILPQSFGYWILLENLFTCELLEQWKQLGNSSVLIYCPNFIQETPFA